MDILPNVRKKILQRKVEKMLDDSVCGDLSSEEVGLLCHEISIEGFVNMKLDYFFNKLGGHEINGLYDTVISQVERPLIEGALKWAEGNKLKAARVLGVNRNTLRSKIKKLKINPSTLRPEGRSRLRVDTEHCRSIK